MINETILLPIQRFEVNAGQLPNVPHNPRQITPERLESLKKSIKELPDMLSLREVIAVGNLDDPQSSLVIIAGNLRYLAALELGFSELPAKILPLDTDPYKLAQIAIKDNNQWGQWDYDALANEWSDYPLVEWGIEELAEWDKADDDTEVSISDIEEVSGATANKYPLAIILTLQDFKRWQTYKLEIDKNDDTAAFLQLFELWAKAET